MALRKRLATGPGIMLAKAAPVFLKEGKVDAQDLAYLFSLFDSIIEKINGRISIGDGTQASQSGNVDGQLISVAFPTPADTEIEVPHGLDRIPIALIPLLPDRACSVYGSNIGSWTKTRMLLKCNVASASVSLWIL